MKSLTKQEENYNIKFEEHMKRNYNMTQYIQEPTHNNKSQEPTHNNESLLDLCFSTTDMNTSLIWNHWSDYIILAVSINM